MNFMSRNLNIFTPKILAGIFIVFALLQLAGVTVLNSVWFTIGDFRLTAMTVISLVLAVGILLDARK